MENEQIMRKIAQDVYQENQTRGQFSPQKIPVHTHNGIDNQKINAKNLIYNNKILTGITAEAQAVTQVTFSLGIFNPTSVTVYGIIRNNLAGTAVKKASFTGNAQLGSCFELTSFTSISSQKSVVQACSISSFDNTTGSWVPSVSTTASYLGAFDSIGTNAYIKVVSYDNTSITFEVFADTDWRITCNLIIT